MLIRRTALSFGLVLVLSACNQPAVTPKLPAFQPSENTVRDWKDVADKIAVGMAARGLLPPLQGEATAVPVSPRHPIFIRLQAPNSMFARVVGEELKADVLDRGGVVARTPAGATVVNFDVDFVRWGPRDKPPGPLGTLAGIAAIPGLIAGASTFSKWAIVDAGGLAGVGYGALADGIIALTPTMNAEAVWEATIVVDDRELMRLQSPVYVRNNDLLLYASSVRLSPLDSWEADRPLTARRLSYAN